MQEHPCNCELTESCHRRPHAGVDFTQEKVSRGRRYENRGRGKLSDHGFQKQSSVFQDSRILSLNKVFPEVITSQMDEELLLVDAGGAEALDAQRVT